MKHFTAHDMRLRRWRWQRRRKQHSTVCECESNRVFQNECQSMQNLKWAYVSHFHWFCSTIPFHFVLAVLLFLSGHLLFPWRRIQWNQSSLIYVFHFVLIVTPTFRFLIHSNVLEYWCETISAPMNMKIFGFQWNNQVRCEDVTRSEKQTNGTEVNRLAKNLQNESKQTRITRCQIYIQM